jgi:predicted phage tail protein
MNSSLVNIKLHGALGKQVGRESWKMAVSSVGEAMRAIESQSKKLYKSLIKNDKQNIKYRVLINEKDFLYDKEKDINTKEGVQSSELIREFKNLESIDIVPVVEGADFKDVFAIIVGIVLIVLGVFTYGATTQMGMALIAGGLGLVAAGVANLLTPMPEFGDFREIEGGGRTSYLFAGPVNTVREGGPIFIGYGRLMVGSQVIQSSIDTFDVESGKKKNTSKLTKSEHWGKEYYGLDYRDNVRNKGEETVQGMMRKRAAEHNEQSVEADECAPHKNVDTEVTTIITSDGDDYTVVRTTPIIKPHVP